MVAAEYMGRSPVTPEVLVSAIRERLDEIERKAETAPGSRWEATTDDSIAGASVYDEQWRLLEPNHYDHDNPLSNRPGASGPMYIERARDALVAHIALHDPSSVLRRVQADRRVLARHWPIRDLEDTETICARCSGASFDLGVLVGHYSPVTRWPCGDFRDLADGMGIDLPEDTGGDDG